MKAAVLHAPDQPMSIEEVTFAKPRRKEALMRTEMPRRPTFGKQEHPNSGQLIPQGTGQKEIDSGFQPPAGAVLRQPIGFGMAA